MDDDLEERHRDMKSSISRYSIEFHLISDGFHLMTLSIEEWLIIVNLTFVFIWFISNDE